MQKTERIIIFICQVPDSSIHRTRMVHRSNQSGLPRLNRRKKACKNPWTPACGANLAAQLCKIAVSV
jgi:hypothetical protein